MPLGKNSKNKIIFIVGPTAAGKTEVAVKLAERINAEIISCDSMQIYKGMEILTSQPSLGLRRKIPHHLLGIVSPYRQYNVSLYRRAAIRKIRVLTKRGKTPLFVGGTGLYMSILIDGIFKTRAQDEKIRRRLYGMAGSGGSQYLYRRLKKIDPLAVARIHPNDTKRIIRALEVFEITGKPISELQKQRRGLGSDYDLAIFGLDMGRLELYRRIDQRIEMMFKKGLAMQVRRLLRRRLSRTASYAIGIKELKGHFDGLYDLAEAKRLIKRNTRRYAKRQLTWFRKDRRIKWIEISAKEKPQGIADKIWKGLY